MATFRMSSGTRCERKPRIKYHWTHEEDELLTLIVNINGPEKWDRIAAHIHGRTGKSCRIRWLNHLNPTVNKMPFSAEEKQKLLELHKKYGNRWATIARSLPGRTDNQVKNQYHSLTGSKFAKSSGSSSLTDPHGAVSEGSIGLSRYQSKSTVPIGSQYYSAFAPYSARPSSTGGSSSMYGQGKTFTRVSPHSSIPGSSGGVGFYPYRRIIDHANSSKVEELCPVPQPHQGVAVRDYQFIDFLGVGSSE